jgi:hypothetical protein
VSVVLLWYMVLTFLLYAELIAGTLFAIGVLVIAALVGWGIVEAAKVEWDS